MILKKKGEGRAGFTLPPLLQETRIQGDGAVPEKTPVKRHGIRAGFSERIPAF
jgi:hypothetical protein